MHNNSTKIFKLEGKVQHYAWGGNAFIPQLLQQQNTSGQPFAEYWMGAHDNVPSSVVFSDLSVKPLNSFISEQPVDTLGPVVKERFGRLPFLFKVLDVKDMLSIQVHPSKEAAVLEFAAENKKGTPLNASNRNYKDDNHKPELMYALSEFWLLHGFKPAGSLKKVLQAVPELNFLLPVFEQGGYPELYKVVMEMPQDEVDSRLRPLLDRILPLYAEGKLPKTNEDFWAARAANTYNEGGKTDRGIFSIYIFNLVHLQTGDTVFQDAGIPHAYLEGQNMELMANSDNVLRGGLTPKHVDVSELMKHVRFEPVTPHIIKGITGEVPEEQVYVTPAADFELRSIRLAAGQQINLVSNTVEIFFVYEGAVDALSGEAHVAVHKGEAMVAIAGAVTAFKAQQETLLFRATTPSVEAKTTAS
ncbi:MAG: mannose-6-phosphate isomerase, class I [Candidatus Pseudobacter hemicellulosilyticus]|uniref:mannose-6-phosphate isomerase n=1 Tax=Candidatus Pseudobacter hemicellulosilyticus TaxID=3121375 RepID=A0AAJ6BE99_9BACT|nr:MAG: mannose-6-phosphate isomerase, class I [Pseudobacter sp.]